LRLDRDANPRDELGDDQLIIGAALEPDSPAGDDVVRPEAEALIEARQVIKSGKLAGKSMSAAIWILAIPVLLQQLMQACVGLVDKMLAGSLPREIAVSALDGISIGSYVGWFINIALAGLGIGGQAIIARAMGSGDRFEAGRALGQAMSLSLLWGAAVGVLLWFIAPGLARLCGLAPEGTLYCVQYVRTMSVSIPLAAVMMVGSMCMHGAGETTRPAVIALWVNVVNLVGSWLFSGVLIRAGETTLPNPSPIDPLHWGVIGIAAGTGLSYIVGGVLTWRALARGVKDLKLQTDQMLPEAGMIWRVVRIGVPNFAEGIAMWAVNLFVLQFIGQIAMRAASNGEPGQGLQGAHVIAVQWEAFSFLPGFAIGTAAGALAGQYLGAGNAQMARRAVIVCTVAAMVVMGLLGIIFMIFGRPLTAIISDQPVHLNHVPNLLLICGAVQVFFALAMVVRQGLRGAGDSLWVFFITTFSSYAVRLPLSYMLGVAMGLGIEGIWLGLCGELVIRGLLFTARFVHGGWMRIKV
jgi:putative MATE family efflux protein